MAASVTGRKGHVPELDGVRGIAIALVLVFHFGLDGRTNDASWHQAMAIGWVGVDLFFVLSGFLLGGQILDAGEGFNKWRFWWRRGARILPLYALLVLSWWLMRDFGPEQARWSVGHLPLWVPLTLTMDLVEGFHLGLGMFWIGPTWSLAIEEHFYLLLPLALPWATRRGRVPHLCIAAILFAYFFRFFIGLWGGLTSIYYPFPSRIDAPAAGVLLAWLVRNTAVLQWRPWLSYAAIPLAILAAFQAVFGRYMVMRVTLIYTIIAIGAMAAIAATMQGGRFARAVRAAPLRWLGTRSYGLYLWHFPALILVELATPPGLYRLLLAALLCFAAAELSFRLVESPAIQLAARLQARRVLESSSS